MSRALIKLDKTVLNEPKRESALSLTKTQSTSPLVTMTPLDAIITIPLGILTNRISEAWLKSREKTFELVLNEKVELEQALVSLRSLREEVARVCLALAKSHAHFEITPESAPLHNLLCNPLFHADLADFLGAGEIQEGGEAKTRLLSQMTDALQTGGASEEHVHFIKTQFFETVEKAIFSNTILAHWRHQLSLQFLQEQVARISALVASQAGLYDASVKKEALDHYASVALKAWDIIDLSNLPEGDVQITTQAPLLRQLYVPLRVTIEADRGSDGMPVPLDELETRREQGRRKDAGWFGDDESAVDGENARYAVGARIEASQRLIVLGDPGGGKTTLLRWMATAYLLRYLNDPAYDQLPDTETLPVQTWIPILIRCRELGEADLCRSFQDFLTQHFRKSELRHDEAEIMRAVVLESIVAGKALLLVDGLDEISDSNIRAKFCQELERVSIRYPALPILVTSRIVGYRDMPYRMGAGFEHTVISNLLPAEKDDFAARWISVTEERKPTEERKRLLAELTEALHSSNRIERLTGNPLLLTTLALVKRKVGRLPNRRIDLYREAVPVLLNWNPLAYTQIEEREAMPQLSYLAYEMCRRGVQQLTEDEVLGLLESVRVDYPNIRILKERTPRQFLTDLEARSSILIQSGGIWEKGTNERVYEFRHLTFQEYLAARALLAGHYPGRNKSLTLAEQIAPLAGEISDNPERGEIQVAEAWRETLRLVVAGAKDDDVDETILAILNPQPGDDLEKTTRPRAILAASCLVDEPNAAEDTIQTVINSLVLQIGPDDGDGSITTSLETVAVDLSSSPWGKMLSSALLTQFRIFQDELLVMRAGGVFAMIESMSEFRGEMDLSHWSTSVVQRLKYPDERAIGAALIIMHAAWQNKMVIVPETVEGLLALLNGSQAAVLAGTWALGWLSQGGREFSNETAWKPTVEQTNVLLHKLVDLGSSHAFTKGWLIISLGHSGQQNVVSEIGRYVDDRDDFLRISAQKALGRIGGEQAAEYLRPFLSHAEDHWRRSVVEALAMSRSEQEKKLLSSHVNAHSPWIDPVEKITVERITTVSQKLNLSYDVIRSQYEALAESFNLKLEENKMENLPDRKTDK